MVLQPKNINYACGHVGLPKDFPGQDYGSKLKKYDCHEVHFR